LQEVVARVAVQLVVAEVAAELVVDMETVGDVPNG
jgi:hypothetical protein